MTLTSSLVLSSFASVFPAFVPTALAFVTPTCTPQDSNLVAYWKLDEGAGTTAADSIGGNTGSIGGTVSWSLSSPPPIGFADPASLNFNGTDTVVTVGDVFPLRFDTADAFSVSTWVNGTAFSGYQVIAHKIDDAAATKRGYLFVLNAGVPEVWIINDYGAGNYLHVAGASAVGIGSWHHLAFTYNGSGVASGVGVYVDGSAQATTVIQDTLSGTITNSASFEIGARSLAGQSFNGLMDDVRVYDAALIASQVGRLATAYCGADKLTPTALSTSSSVANTSTYGDSVTFTATVTGGYSPTGTVDFKDGLTTIATGVALSVGTATYTTNALSAGSRSITAVYSGDNENVGVTSAPITQTVNQATTTTGVLSAPNPSVVGSSATFTATVTGVSPTGSVEFFDGVTSLGTGVVAAGTATLSSSSLIVGSHNITATYSGDANNLTSTSAPALVHVVDKDSPSTSTDLSAPTSSIVGNPVALTGSVTGGYNPSGTVQFLSGTTLLGSATLSGGKASISYTFTTVGSYSITANYLGDGNNNASSDTSRVQVVDKASPITSTVLNAPSTSVVGNSVTLTGNVNGGFNPAGTVEFLSGSVLLGTGSLTVGSASISHIFTVVGSYTLTAHYLGDASNNQSTSTGTVIQVVAKASPVTQTDLSAPTSSIVGNPVSLTGSVTGGYNPSGTMEFMSGATLLGSVTLSGGKASISYTFTTVGSYSITANYLGDGNNNVSSDTSRVQVVDKAASSTSTAIGVPNASIVGQNVTFTASVSGGYNPTGIVNFMEGATFLGSGTLLAGSATFQTSSLSVGNHSIHAEYLGDASNLGSSSPDAVIQVVDKSASTVTLTLSSNVSFLGDAVTLRAVVTGFQPTGTVTFRDAGNTIATVTLGQGSGSTVTSSLALGTHPLDAAYSGDVNNLSNTSEGLSHVVSLTPPPTGGGHGHGITSFTRVAHFVMANASGGGNVAPGAFGGQGDNVIIPSQRAILCTLQRSLPANASTSVIIWVANYISPFFGLKPAIIQQALQDPGLCSGGSASLEPVPIASYQQIMLVDRKGIPVSSNPTWNACIRNTVSISASDYRPLNCGRYHDGNFWKHPDTLVTFQWSSRFRNQLESADAEQLLVLPVR